MKYATLCTGVGGFDRAFDRVGMTPVYQCEINQKCQTVLARHWPNVTKGIDVDDSQTELDIVRLKPDLVAFGSPCQDLSVAGKRGGLSGERSGLFFRCVELCFAAQAPWVVWENVPGVFSSNEGEDFASVIEAFTGVRPAVPPRGWRNTGVCVGPLYSIAWAVLDSQWFGVPQRRRRVFVVGSFRDRGSPYEILSLPESVPWDSPPSRQAGKRVAGEVAACLNSGGNDGGFRTEPGEHIVTHTLKAEGHDASEDGTGRGVPLIAAALRGNYHCDQDGDETKLVAYGGNNTSGPIDIATACNASASASGRQDFESETFVMQERMEAENENSGPGGKGWNGDGVAFTLEARHRPQSMANSHGVRRLTPTECERLQGFPDGWTEFAADGTRISDSARYQMLGNAVTVNVAEYIGRRILAGEW
jgi:DNA (cytosine-5)-methyltransferase 1